MGESKAHHMLLGEYLESVVLSRAFQHFEACMSPFVQHCMQLHMPPGPADEDRERERRRDLLARTCAHELKRQELAEAQAEMESAAASGDRSKHGQCRRKVKSLQKDLDKPAHGLAKFCTVLRASDGGATGDSLGSWADEADGEDDDNNGDDDDGDSGGDGDDNGEIVLTAEAAAAAQLPGASVDAWSLVRRPLADFNSHRALQEAIRQEKEKIRRDSRQPLALD